MLPKCWTTKMRTSHIARGLSTDVTQKLNVCRGQYVPHCPRNLRALNICSVGLLDIITFNWKHLRFDEIICSIQHTQNCTYRLIWISGIHFTYLFESNSFAIYYLQPQFQSALNLLQYHIKFMMYSTVIWLNSVIFHRMCRLCGRGQELQYSY